MKILLYKWPPAPGIDAANPRGVTVNRILSYLGVEYDARIVNPNDTDLDPKKLGAWIAEFPVLMIDGKGVNGIYKILKTLCETIRSEKAINLWTEGGESPELAAWAFDHLYFLAIYARMKREGNFIRYRNSMAKVYGNGESGRTVALMRQIFLEVLKWSSVGVLSESEFAEVLETALASLEYRLSKGGPFLLGMERPSISDFAVFGALQALLTPEIEERSLFSAKYPKLLQWARDTDRISTGRWTRALVNL